MRTGLRNAQTYAITAPCRPQCSRCLLAFCVGEASVPAGARLRRSARDDATFPRSIRTDHPSGSARQPWRSSGSGPNRWGSGGAHRTGGAADRTHQHRLPRQQQRFTKNLIKRADGVVAFTDYSSDRVGSPGHRRWTDHREHQKRMGGDGCTATR